MMMMMKRAMVRQFSSIATSRAKTSLTLRNVISKHIEDLSRKRAHIAKLREIILEHRIEVLNMMQQKVLQSEPKVEHQLDLLQKLVTEVIPITVTHHSHCPLSIIYKYFDDLLRKHAVISQVAESASQGVRLDSEGQELVDTGSIVVHQINLLRQVLHDMAWESQLALDDDQLKNITPDPSFESTVMQPSTAESEPLDNKHRYLLISNGSHIHCLDLKQSKYLPPLSISTDAMHLPIIATLDLLKENLPTTVGVFKWRSNAYMVGGQDHPTTTKQLPDHLYLSVKPTSSRIYGLSLKGTSFISHHIESINMGNLLKKPKICPIVEQINGELHVIDCLPGNFITRRSKGWTGSHEVLDSESCRWIREIEESNVVIMRHLMVGNKIYAESDGRSFMVFDSEKKVWDMVERDVALKSWPGINVWNILNDKRFLDARCVGGFPYGDPRDPLYVVIAPKMEYSAATAADDYNGIFMVALLVNSSGQILCSQHLTDFFSVSGSFRLGREGSTIIQVEEEEEDKLGEKKKKKTMCSIFMGKPWEDFCNSNYVSIDIFSVEELPDAADKVRRLKESVGEARQPPVELEFVCVHVMERHFFKREADGVGSRGFNIKVQACFL